MPACLVVHFAAGFPEAILEGSIVGKDARVSGHAVSVNVGDSSAVCI